MNKEIWLFTTDFTLQSNSIAPFPVVQDVTLDFIGSIGRF